MFDDLPSVTVRRGAVRIHGRLQLGRRTAVTLTVQCRSRYDFLALLTLRGRLHLENWLADSWFQWRRARAPKARGPHARALDFLREVRWVAGVAYPFLRDELKKPEGYRDPRLRRVIREDHDEIERLVREYREHVSPSSRSSSHPKLLTAYLVQRAFQGGWRRFGIQPPAAAPDQFFQVHVYRHTKAVRHRVERRVQRAATPEEHRRVQTQLQKGREWALRLLLGSPGYALACLL